MDAWYVTIVRPDGRRQWIAIPDLLVKKFMGKLDFGDADPDKAERVSVLRMAEAEVWSGP